MKKWLCVLMTITLSLGINNIFANEQLDIYDEPEYINRGTVVINFLSKIKEDAEEEIDNPVVEGVEIELYYKYNGEMINVKELPQFQDKDLNFVSDVNGKIILSNFPYGFYQYYIVYVPLGYKSSTEVRKIDLNVLNNNFDKYDFIVEDIQLAEGSTIIEEEPEEEKTNVEENKEVNIEVTQENTNGDRYLENVSQVTNQMNTNNNNIRINSILNNSYNKIQSGKNDNILDKKITNSIKLSGEKLKLDILDAMKNIKINDAIKIAILDNNRDLYKIYHVVSDLPRDSKYRKHKKVITVERITLKNENINYINNIHLGVQRQIMR